MHAAAIQHALLNTVCYCPQLVCASGNAVQETQWEPPGEGFLPAPAEWLAYVHQQATLAQAASLQEHATHTTQAADLPLPLDSSPDNNSLQDSSRETGRAEHSSPGNTRLHSAAERTGTTVQQLKSSPKIVDLESAAQLMHASAQQPVVCDAECSQHQPAAGELSHCFNSRGPARPESSGLMAKIPAPAGTHIRFADSDEDTADGASHRQAILHDSPLDTEAHNASRSFSSASLQQPANRNQSSDELAADKQSLVQAAVDGMLASTVVTSEHRQQTEPLNTLGLPASTVVTAEPSQQTVLLKDTVSPATPQATPHDQSRPVSDTMAKLNPSSSVSLTTHPNAASSSRSLANKQASSDESAGKAPDIVTALQHRSLDDSQHHVMGAQEDTAELDSSQHYVTQHFNRNRCDMAGVQGDIPGLNSRQHSMPDSDSCRHHTAAAEANIAEASDVDSMRKSVDSSQHGMTAGQGDIAEASGVDITHASSNGAVDSIQHDTAAGEDDIAEATCVDITCASSQSDMAGAEGDMAEASGVGITYASLGGALQSKKALPRRLWKYWLQRYSLFSRFVL